MSGQGVNRFAAARAMAHAVKSSKAEHQARELLDRFGLAWRAQVPIGRWVIDLIVGMTAIEVHGSYWHDRPLNRERDARRRVALEALGYRVIELRTDRMHFWWEQLQPLVSSAESVR